MYTILKVTIGLVGLAFTLVNFIPGVSGNKLKLKKAAIIFFTTWLVVVLISVIEFTMVKK